ncbi:MAG: nicotinate phosphoribosyltransferase [Patescibacteria group bacterium]
MSRKKSRNIPKTHLLTEEDIPLYDIQNIYTACTIWYESGMKDIVATYDLTVRELPKNRNFMIAGGLEEVVEGIRKKEYTAADIRNLKKAKLITSSFGKYLAKYKFTGNIHALPEGTIFFPGEPVIRVTAPIIEGNLMTMFLMGSVLSHTIYLSKMVRVVLAAAGKGTIIGGGLRAHSFEAGMKSVRAGWILSGACGMPSANVKYRLPDSGISVNLYHAVIKSFPSEIEAIRASTKIFPNRVRPMVDTYDFTQGVKNVITVAQELKKKDQKIAGITIDSGDLHKRAVQARKMFDRADFPDIKITLASNLDEWKIAELIKQKTPVDTFLVQTEINTIADDPRLEIVYKLAEMRDGKKITQTAKFSPGKQSYPGRKQVYRRFKGKKISADIIGLEKEKLGQPLLIPIIKKGKIVYRLPELSTIQNYSKQQLDLLPGQFKSIHKVYKYPVKISPKLKLLLNKVKKEHK